MVTSKLIFFIRSYVFTSDFQSVKEVPDGLGPPAEDALQAGADEVRVERLGVGGLGQEADHDAHQNAGHAGDGREPHVGDLVEHQVREPRVSPKKTPNSIKIAKMGAKLRV